MIFGSHADNTLEQFKEINKRAKYSALMADGHLGYHMPVGGVAAYEHVFPIAGVGYDIACGNCAINTGKYLVELFENGRTLEDIANEIQSKISFGVGRTNASENAPTNDPLFEEEAWEIIPATHREKLKDKAREQLGTVGSGNHYVDIFVDSSGKIWTGVHFGSRGLGHTIASAFMALSVGKKWGDKVSEEEAQGGYVDDRTDLGRDYLKAMDLCGKYAYAGREWVAREVVHTLFVRSDILGIVHNHHNFAWKETHYDKTFIVVRKGATPAFPEQKGFVGGSMGDNSVILQGRYREGYSEGSLYSTVHGAGRVMSRTQAGGKYKGWGNKRVKVRDGAVTQEMMENWLKGKNVILRGGGLDESPHAYRRLDGVLKDQLDTIKIIETLEPLIVVMAGENEFDPYKD